MKRFAVTTAFLAASSLAFAGAAYAQGTGHEGHHVETKKPESGKKTESRKSATYSTSGVVKKVDQSRGTLTLSHEPIPALKWPAMTMVFKVNDKAMLQKVSADQKVNFEFRQQGKDYVITSIK